MKPVWLDADPGFDDWLAMLMLAQNAEIDWVGTSIVHGNAPLASTLQNAINICEYYGLPTPLFAGCDQALGGIGETAQKILGETGMRTSAATLPIARTPLQSISDDAVSILVNTIGQFPKKLTILATGPLTNIATALKRQPTIAAQVGNIILMGGSTDRGNHTPAAEFNIYADPEAADIVFQSGIDITMFGLNVCRNILLTQQDTLRFKSLVSARAQCFTGYLDGYQRIRSSDGNAPMPLYDPVVTAFLKRPELFDLVPAHVAIELCGTHTRGMTVCDFKVNTDRPANVLIGAVSSNANAIRDLILGDAYERLLKFEPE
jgi:purine nucleosidase